MESTATTPPLPSSNELEETTRSLIEEIHESVCRDLEKRFNKNGDVLLGLVLGLPDDFYWVANLTSRKKRQKNSPPNLIPLGERITLLSSYLQSESLSSLSLYEKLCGLLSTFVKQSLLIDSRPIGQNADVMAYILGLLSSKDTLKLLKRAREIGIAELTDALLHRPAFDKLSLPTFLARMLFWTCLEKFYWTFSIIKKSDYYGTGEEGSGIKGDAESHFPVSEITCSISINPYALNQQRPTLEIRVMTGYSKTPLLPNREKIISQLEQFISDHQAIAIFSVVRDPGGGSMTIDLTNGIQILTKLITLIQSIQIPEPDYCLVLSTHTHSAWHNYYWMEPEKALGDFQKIFKLKTPSFKKCPVLSQKTEKELLSLLQDNDENVSKNVASLVEYQVRCMDLKRIFEKMGFEEHTIGMAPERFEYRIVEWSELLKNPRRFVLLWGLFGEKNSFKSIRVQLGLPENENLYLVENTSLLRDRLASLLESNDRRYAHVDWETRNTYLKSRQKKKQEEGRK